MSQQATKPFFTPQESPLFIVRPFQGILVVFVEQYPFVSFQET
jgi:hypothetical protein